MAQVLHDRVIERLIAFLLAHLNHTGDLVRFGFPNEVGNCHIDDQNFERCNTAGAVDSFKKILCDYALERFRQRRPQTRF